MIRACGWSAAFWCSVVSRRNASTTLGVELAPGVARELLKGGVYAD
jgi:hypothetical protein